MPPPRKEMGGERGEGQFTPEKERMQTRQPQKVQTVHLFTPRSPYRYFYKFKLCECSIYSRPPPILGIGGGRSRMRAVGGEVRGGENAQELDDTLITSAEE